MVTILPVNDRRTWVSLLALCVWVGASVSGCTRHASAAGAAPATVDPGSTSQHAALLALTPGQGAPGSTVAILVTDCPTRGSTPNQITWQNLTQAMKGAGGGHVDVGGVTRTGNELRATFTVPPNSPLGTSIFDAPCGRPSGGALAAFTVTAS
jgi:hypothetical protein